MRKAAGILLLVCVAITFGCATFQADSLLAEWFSGSDKVHQAVQFHEREPLSEKAGEIQPILAAHFKAVDYIICGDVIGPLFDSDNDLHHIIGWQIIFGSGDWVEKHPDQSDDIDSYTLAGLESGIRAYATAIKQNSRIQSDLMDKLLDLFNDDQLQNWSDEHPCRPE